MRVLVACEYSGIVRDAFRARGHDAWSCDLLPTDRPRWTIDPVTDKRTCDDRRGEHYQGNVGRLVHPHNLASIRWDLMIGHPPCTYICNSGVRWLYTGGRGTVIDDERWGAMVDACNFFTMLLRAGIPKVAVENPIPHKHAMTLIGERASQIIQPWQFGCGETKATCLWLKNLPILKPTNIVSGRKPVVHHASPGPNRGHQRSITCQGIADAMAAQWG